MQDLGRFAPLWRFAEELADAARAVCLGYFRADNKTVGVRQKSDDSPVTRADRACERALRAMIGRRFPAHRVIGEEFGRAGGDDSESSPTWVLDPIDGTRSFLGGSPLFCSLIAYAENGRPLLGVIDMPALGERWIGIDAVENGARIRATQKNAAACRVSKCRLLARARGGVSTIGLPGANARKDAALRRLFAATRGRLGGDAFNYGCVASGYSDLAFDSMMKPHDYMALAPIVAAAGGVICDWRGRDLSLDLGETEVVAAATAALRDAALSVLGQHAASRRERKTS